MNVLIAFLFMLAVASLAGILLSIFSYFFAVEQDPTEKAIRACLPGINCGACGYKGCDDYAAALATGSAKPNLCVPGEQKVADQISEILAMDKLEIEDVVAFVACDGHCGATSKLTKYEGVQSCLAASMLYGGPNSCHYGCLGFGDCAAVCPSDAICMKDGIARVDTSRCVGCGLCKQTCPKGIIQMLPQEAGVAVMCSNTQKGATARKACTNACIACKKCEKTCPYGAITVKDNLAVVDYTKCTRCGACVKECPTGCLKQTCFPDLPEDYELHVDGTI